MSLFYNPQKSGRGVSKNEVELKPFPKFWDLFGRKFLYLLQLNFIYLVLCIPLVTIGPSTAAMTHVMRKFVLEQPIFVFVELFSAFKKHFKQTIGVGLVSLMFFVAFGYSMYFYNIQIAEDPYFGNYFMFAMNMVAGAVFLTVNIYLYPQIVCLDLSMRAMLKNSVKFCLLGFKRNVITVLITGIVAAVIFTAPVALIVLPLMPFAQLAFLSMFNAYPIIQKYVINPFYESQGKTNPEIIDYTDFDDKKSGENKNIFTDFGGKETPINKKSVKTTGKVIK